MGWGRTYSKQELQCDVGEDVDANLLALGNFVALARPIGQASREDLLDDLGRVLDDRLLLFVARVDRL